MRCAHSSSSALRSTKTADAVLLPSMLMMRSLTPTRYAVGEYMGAEAGCRGQTELDGRDFHEVRMWRGAVAAAWYSLGVSDDGA